MVYKRSQNVEVILRLQCIRRVQCDPYITVQLFAVGYSTVEYCSIVTLKH